MKNEIVEEVSNKEDSFLLVMQTQHQQTLLRKYGNIVTLMDGVYHTTKYGFPCFFLVVKTSLGMGRVVGTIIPQQENEILLAEGLMEPRLESSLYDDRQKQRRTGGYWSSSP